jgi:hypothetical protein
MFNIDKKGLHCMMLLLIVSFISCTSSPAFIETGVVIDNSYPIIGNIVETGKLSYVEQGILSNKKLPSPQKGITGIGKVFSLGFGETTTQLKYKNINQPIILLLNHRHEQFRWNGNIFYDGDTVQARVVIDIYGREKMAYFVLNSATTATSYIDFNGSIHESGGVTEIPYWFGTFFSSNGMYRLYGVCENEYQINPDNTLLSDDEKEKAMALYKENYSNAVSNFFLDTNQKFQIIDNEDNVVAEIKDDAYTLYDTLPELERINMKQNIGLFHIFYSLVRQSYNRTI